MKVSPPTALTPAVSPAENEKLHQVSRQFEALFVNQLVTAMRKTIVKGGLVPESDGERVYQGLLDTEYARRIAESDQIGLSKLIYKQLLQAQTGK